MLYRSDLSFLSMFFSILSSFAFRDRIRSAREPIRVIADNTIREFDCPQNSDSHSYEKTITDTTITRASAMSRVSMLFPKTNFVLNHL